ncbi:MAG: MarR family transcriptional regulator [Nitrososphaerota archaeon]|nr:MarR family transcriptional regulator [Nitrososphaerota archaeon]MDG7024533.1 MarR family transcriptional regulator [Nitrososphaerota archaeon]
MSSEEVGDFMMVIWQRWRSTSPVRKGAITREQYWILRTLLERGGMRVKDLASAIGCTAGSASVAVKRLEKSGLVRRERGGSDERVVTVTLEKLGAKKLDAWRDEQLSAMADLFRSLGAGERRTLRDLLGKALTASGDLPSTPASRRR